MKKWLIAAAILLGVGLIIGFVSLVLLDYDFTKLNTINYETKTYELADDPTDIVINTSTDNIKFVHSEDGKCKVVCLYSEKMYNKIDEKDGTLTIEHVDERKWYENFGIFGKTGSLTVYLPSDKYGTLTIKTSTGNVTIPEGFEFENVFVQGSTCDVSCKSSVKDQIKIEQSTGDVELYGLSAEKIYITTSTGDIKAESVNVSGSFAAHVSTGKVVLTGLRCETLLSTGSTGDVYLTNTIASGKLSIERDTGDVCFNKSDAESIIVKTSTGNVTGSLLSEKIFFTKTSTGKISVPKTTSGGTCDITTSTGRITITIEGN
ncbi:MAG: DUF4097 family beta strand repeat protein [Oscillospiraceae bacterium]|nr:DUF4097 family beta strand repeat protein [Oscillospiraceae bacterium]